jgi:hypothetical protein
MSESSAVPVRGRQDIVTLTDGMTIRVVLIFKAPSWEDARKVYAWAMEHLGKRTIKEPLSWPRARALIQFRENPNTKKTVPSFKAAPAPKRSKRLWSVKSDEPSKKS